MTVHCLGGSVIQGLILVMVKDLDFDLDVFARHFGSDVQAPNTWAHPTDILRGNRS